MRNALVVAAAAMSYLAFPTPAVAQGEPRQSYTDTFTTKKPATSAGRVATIDFFDPENPEGKPNAISRILVQLHPGSRFDTSAVPRCSAPDAELTARGPGACPGGSKVGEAEILVDTGFPEPGRFLPTDFTILNGDQELIFVGEERQSGGRLVIRGEVRGNVLDIPVPLLPGTPPDGAAPTSEKDVFFERSGSQGGGGGFLTTPPACPAGGAWTNRVTYFYRDGVVQTATSASPCIRRGAGDEAPGNEGGRGNARPGAIASSRSAAPTTPTALAATAPPMGSTVVAVGTRSAAEAATTVCAAAAAPIGSAGLGGPT